MPQKKKQNGAKKKLPSSPRKQQPRASRVARRSTRPRSDISVAAPVGSAAQQHMLPPKISRSARGARIVHREFVGSIANTNGTLGVTKFACNPGIAATFPWLAVQAADWEQYTFHKLRFQFITRSATTEVGSVILSPDYDPSDISPTTEAQITAYQDTVEDVPWKDQDCHLDPRAMHPTGPRKFVRSGRPYGDIKLYDAANLFVGTLGASTNSIGKLWVEYDVEFFVPQLGAAQSSGPEGTSMYLRSTAQTFATGTAANLDWDAATYDPVGFGSDAAGTFTPPAGSYLLQYTGSFADSSAEVFNAEVRFLKNGANITGAFSAVDFTAPAAGAGVVPLNFVITANGTDTFAVSVKLVGVAGTLTSIANAQQLIVSAA